MLGGEGGRGVQIQCMFSDRAYIQYSIGHYGMEEMMGHVLCNENHGDSHGTYYIYIYIYPTVQ